MVFFMFSLGLFPGFALPGFIASWLFGLCLLESGLFGLWLFGFSAFGFLAFRLLAFWLYFLRILSFTSNTPASPALGFLDFWLVASFLPRFCSWGGLRLSPNNLRFFAGRAAFQRQTHPERTPTIPTPTLNPRFGPTPTLNHHYTLNRHLS